MNEKLLYAIGEIDDLLIKEAEDYAPYKRAKFNFKKLTAMAASFAVVLLLSLSMIGIFGIVGTMKNSGGSAPPPGQAFMNVSQIEVVYKDGSHTISSEEQIDAILHELDVIISKTAPTQISESYNGSTVFEDNEYLFILSDNLGNSKTYRLYNGKLTDEQERLQFDLRGNEWATFKECLGVM